MAIEVIENDLDRCEERKGTRSSEETKDILNARTRHEHNS